MNELDTLVENHLNLQVKISYGDHHDFLIRHGLIQCAHVLDIGSGNGVFVSRLSLDHPSIQFVGLDKRKSCIDSAHKLKSHNLEFTMLDMFSKDTLFDFSQFDGLLMRYFLLHVDHAQKILEFILKKSKHPTKLWIIDLDSSQFSCIPHHPHFDKLTNLVKEFCKKVSPEALGSLGVLPILKKLDFKNIVVEHLPFSSLNIPISELALYIKQEILCYSVMSGRSTNDAETSEIIQFIDEDLKSGKYQINYGMTLISAEIG
jgi:ubiquinone/menaquinone biosynthesis C-methylase UbiE